MLVPLHAGFAKNPGFGSWQLEPTVIVGTAVAIFFYYRWIRRYESSHPGEHPASGKQQAAFLAGIFTIVIALISPIDIFGSYLLTMHMTQHLLLTIVGPPLLLLGLPREMCAAFARTGTIWEIWRKLTRPLVGFIVFNATFTLIHLPPAYNLILRNEPVHIASHMAFIGTALLSWWSVLAPGREYGELPPAIKAIYLLAHTIPGQLAGGIITLSGSILYVEYTHAPFRLWGMSLMTDQQVGGMLMWVGVGTFYLVAAGVAFFRWASVADNEERQRLSSTETVR